ncbi:MAG: Gfo/Idh/MocA family oxidoreductase [Fimbriimonadaceae bacterium]|nr:Gfo/Idh/MocA family oxidoreductase [Fimbriimonadaceae bacterium]
MSDAIRIAIIGCGQILPAHLNGFKALWDVGIRDFRIVALCSERAADAARYADRGEAPPVLQQAPGGVPHLWVNDIHPDPVPTIYTDYRDLLADPLLRLDAVLILTPHQTHHPIALAALQRGLHVLLEKPLAYTVATARRLCEAAAAAGRQLQVAEVAHFREVTRMAGWLLGRGDLGPLQVVVEHVLGMGWSPRRLRGDTPWRHRLETAGGGLTLDRGVHVLHTLEQVAGPIDTAAAWTPILEPQRYVGDRFGHSGEPVECTVDDTFVAQLRFAGGAVGQVSYSAALSGDRTALPLTVHGRQGTLRGGRLSFAQGPPEMVVSRFQRTAPTAVQRSLFRPDLHCPWAAQLEDWLQAIRSGQPGELRAEVGLRDVALAWTLLESDALNGQPVAVADVLAGRCRARQAALDASAGS